MVLFFCCAVVTEIARQAAQIKLLRKLQKQEQARAAKEAKKQQGINMVLVWFYSLPQSTLSSL